MCKTTTGLAYACLGVVTGVSGCLVFFIVFHNYLGGTWAALSFVFAAICLHIQYLVWRHKMEAWHTEESLHDLSGLGVVVATISSAFFIWYLFAIFYWHIPILPISDSRVIPAVWSFMTTKWGVTLAWITRKYRIRMQLGLPLLEGAEDTSES